MARRIIAALTLMSLVCAAALVQLTHEGGLLALVPSRAQAPAVDDRPTPGREEAHARLRTASLTPTRPSNHYQFSLPIRPGRQPVTWSPCRAIHYVVRPDNAPPGGARLLDEAFSQLSDATGLVFVDDGHTDERPSLLRKSFQRKRYGDRWAPALIAWAAAGEVEYMNVDALGSTSAQPFQPAGGEVGLVSGFVYLNAPALAAKLRDGQEPVVRKVLLHELAHLVGLDHVADQGQIMAAHAGRNLLTTYQDGDLTCLNQLGRGPCSPQL